MSDHPRPDDHLVEPIYSALDSGASEPNDTGEVRRRGALRVLVALSIIALLACAIFVLML